MVSKKQRFIRKQNRFDNVTAIHSILYEPNKILIGVGETFVAER